MKLIVVLLFAVFASFSLLAQSPEEAEYGKWMKTINATMGGTDLRGDLAVDASPEIPLLTGQVASRVDLRHPGGACRDRAVRLDAGLPGSGVARLQLARSLREGGPLFSERLEGAPMFLHPLLVDGCQRPDRSCRARKLAQVLRVEQHLRVSTATAFVHVHQMLLHIGQLGQSLEFEAGQSIRGLPQLVLRGRGLSGRLLCLLALEVALDLELAQIAHQRPGFACEPVSFTLKCADAIGDALTLIPRGR